MISTRMLVCEAGWYQNGSLQNVLKKTPKFCMNSRAFWPMIGGGSSGGSRIFQRRERHLQRGRQPIIWSIFLENCMKMEDILSKRGVKTRPLDPPLARVLTGLRGLQARPPLRVQFRSFSCSFRGKLAKVLG